MVEHVAEIGPRVVVQQLDVEAHQPIAHLDQRGDRPLHCQQVALELVDLRQRRPIHRLVGIADELFLEVSHVLLEGRHDRKVLIDEEVH